MLNKKGMELPITAIIVLIIAITFLGLSVYFINTMWKKGTTSVEGQFSMLSDQERTSMEQSGKIIGFTFGDELEVKKGSAREFRVYLKNSFANPSADKKSVCHTFRIKCVQAMSEGNTCSQNAPEGTPVVVGGYVSGQDTKGETWFPMLVTKKVDIPNNEYQQSKGKIQVTTAKADIYTMEAELLVATNHDDCNAASDFETAATERFTLTLT